MPSPLTSQSKASPALNDGLLGICPNSVDPDECRTVAGLHTVFVFV